MVLLSSISIHNNLTKKPKIRQTNIQLEDEKHKTPNYCEIRYFLLDNKYCAYKVLYFLCAYNICRHSCFNIIFLKKNVLRIRGKKMWELSETDLVSIHLFT